MAEQLPAENIAEKYNISREQQDEFAVLIQQKTAKAIANGEFIDDIVPITVKKHNWPKRYV